jgi:hypothetical protein
MPVSKGEEQKDDKRRLTLRLRNKEYKAFNLWCAGDDIEPAELFEILIKEHCPEKYLGLVENESKRA